MTHAKRRKAQDPGLSWLYKNRLRCIQIEGFGFLGVLLEHCSIPVKPKVPELSLCQRVSNQYGFFIWIKQGIPTIDWKDHIPYNVGPSSFSALEVKIVVIDLNLEIIYWQKLSWQSPPHQAQVNVHRMPWNPFHFWRSVFIIARWSRNGPVWRYPIPSHPSHPVTFRFECSKLL